MEKPDSPSSKSVNLNCSSKDNVSPKNNKYPSGRYCHIVKRPDFDGYGFNLHSEKIKPGQYIGKVDPDSPAEAAGLREGDQIIEVNGVNIGVETHKQVVQRIKAISNEVRLFLVDPNTENVANLNKHAEKNSNNKSNNNNNKNLPATNESLPLATTSTVTIVPMATTSPDYQNDKVTSISMVSTKSPSIHSSNNNSTKDEIDFNSKPSEEVLDSNNGYVISTTTTTVTNGKTNDVVATKPTITTTPPPPSPSASSEEQKMDSASINKSSVLASQNSEGINATPQSRRGLNLNLTAAEMRAKLQAKKKFDPKNESVDLKKKFDIIQKL